MTLVSNSLPRQNVFLVVLLALSLLLLPTFSFAPTNTGSALRKLNTCCLRPSQKLPVVTAPSTPTSLRYSNDPASSGYSDDCFGLIAISTTVGLYDGAFGSVFLALSTVGAILTELKTLPANPQVPSAVAGFSLLLTPLVRTFLETSPVLPIDTPRVEQAPLVEIGLCTFSMVYGFIVRRTE